MTVLATETALVGVALLAVLFVTHIYARRRAIAHEHEVLVCGYRPVPTRRWRPSLLRMTPSTLQVFPLFGWTTRPSHTWIRRTLDMSPATPLDDDGGLAAVVDGGRGLLVSVDGRAESGGSHEADLAVNAVQYTTLRYWVESSPSSWPL